MSDRLHHAATSRRIWIALPIAAVVFFVIGNQGGKNGNPVIVGFPICLLLLIVLGVDALVQSRRRRSSQPQDVAPTNQGGKHVAH